MTRKQRASLEEKSAKRLKRGVFRQAILASIATAGVLTVALAAPNALRLLKHANPQWIIGGDPRRRVRETVSKLKQRGLIEFVTTDGRKALRLTRKGELEAHKIVRGAVQIARPRKWDGKWRVIIFDIPEKRRADRQRVRHLLVEIGFERLQDSVWAHPFECEELIVLLKTEMRLGKHLLYMVVDALENDTPLRKRFGL